MIKVQKTVLGTLILFMLNFSCITNVWLVNSELVTNAVSINSDGNVVPSSAPIERNGTVYTLTSNISGSIAVHRNGIVIDGAGYTLKGNGGTGVDLQNNITEVPSSQEIWNVTIKNLAIIGFHFGINTNGGGNDTLYDDYISTSMSGSAAAVSFWGCSGNDITYCSIIGETAVDMQFGSSRNTIIENNFAGNVWVEIGGDETVDRNYWSDYFTKYPNATEVDSTGTGNTPYVFYSYVNSPSGLSSSPLYDNHPQINLINLPIFPAPLVTETTKQSTIPIATMAVVSGAVTIVAVASLWVYFKKHKSRG